MAVAGNEYDAEGNCLEYEHDIDGRSETVRDKMGNITVYTYDEKGQCTSITISREENGGIITITSHYVYNTAGDIIQSIDNMGNVTSYEYDSLGNMVKTTYPDGTFETFTYDANGNCLTATECTI
ncbi:MAG: RHS repeat protein [Lachnospiraceae bacterium]|nr:RHS repeat protein [Lachnospiraceae bacterium]